ncbi:MAG: sigma-70 family RNA polymerase sigma factor [Bryobacterales bacterium]|nr:sigma-70 family RNA polymerase sigma factor [Bryobacterales bacterium]
MASAPSIPDLFQQCAAGDPAAWDAFRARYQRLIVGTIVKEASKYGVRDPEDIADLEQSFSLKLVDRQGHVLRSFSWQGEGSDFRFLKTVAIFYVRDKMVTRPRPVSLSDVNPAAQHADPTERLDIERIRDFARANFSQRDFRVFFLRYFAGLTAKQIASLAAIGLRESGVETVLRKSIERLRDQFGGGALSAGKGTS